MFFFQKYEDLEFQLMEGEAHTESEKEDILHEIRFLENQIQEHEEKLNEIDLIQSQLLSNEFKTQQEFELLKKSLHRSIREESEKLIELSSSVDMSESQQCSDSSSSEEAESKSQHAHQLLLRETPSEILLRKTQAELEQIYSTTESIMSTSTSRMSQSLSRDSQQFMMATAEPTLRSSVVIAIDESEKEDSAISQQSHRNTFTETSR